MIAAVLLSVLTLTQVDSSYERRALWLSHGPGATGVVEGIPGTLVGGGTFRPGALVLDNSRDPGVQREYRASQAAFSRYTVIGGAMMAAELGTIAYYFGKHPHPPNWRAGWGIGLPAATFVLGWATGHNAVAGDDHLRRAMWLYNRQFVRPRAYVSRADCTYDRCALRIRPRARSTQIVRGVNEISIGRIDRQYEFFAAAGDSARVHYEAYLRITRLNNRARRVGLIALLGAGALYASTRNKFARGTAAGLLFVSYAAGHSTAYGYASAASQLDLAIWHYNRTLP